MTWAGEARILLRCAIATFLLLAATVARADAPWVPGRVVVRFQTEGPHALRDCAEQRSRRGQRLAPATADGSDSLDRLHERLGVRRVRALFRRPEDQPFAAQRRRLRERLAAGRRSGGGLPDLSQVYRVELAEGADVAAAVALYRADPHVVYAQPDYRVEAQELEQGLPDDPFFSSAGSWGQPFADLWNLSLVRAPEAWTLSRGEGVVVAVNDTGLDYEHPDMAANGWVNPGEDLDGNGAVDASDLNGVDDDGNGLVDDLRGFDFANSLDADENGDFDGPDDLSDPDPFDDNGHGTHVAGIVAAVGDNGIGVLGVAPRARIMALKGLDEEGSGATSDLARGIVYAASNGARVVNNSWSCSSRCPSNPVAEDAVRAAHALGVVLVFSAGNRFDEVAFYSPQNMRETITVAATNPADEAAAFSNRGFLVDVGAPGAGLPDPPPEASPQAGVLSLHSSETSSNLDGSGSRVVAEDYLRLAGTSMAAPHVTGLVALILAQRPELAPDAVRNLLRLSAEDLAPPGHDPGSGAGRIDAAAALALDPLPDLRAEISAPEVLETLRLYATEIEILGSAGGADFAEYRIFSGEGTAPETWVPLGPVRAAPVEEGTLGIWNLDGLAEGSHVIRLAVRSASGAELETFAPVTLEPNPPRQIGSTGPFDFLPSVSGTQVVWQARVERPDGSPVWNVFGARLEQPEPEVLPIVAGAEEAAVPDLSGARLVWESGGLPAVGATCLLDAGNACEPRSFAGPPASKPTVSGDRVVWLGSSGLFYCELDSVGACDARVLQGGPVSAPTLDGDRVVWSGSTDLFSCRVAPSAEACEPRPLGIELPPGGLVDAPALSGDLLAWLTSGFRGPTELYLCQFDPESGACPAIRIPSDGTPGPPVVSGDRVVWDARLPERELFFCEYDRETRVCPPQRLTSNPLRQINPDIDGNWVIWEDQRVGNFGDIYGFELPSLDPLAERRVQKGQTLRVPVAGRDPLGDPVVLTARQSDGAPLEAVGATFSDFGDGRGELRWQPDFSQAGRHVFRLELSTVGRLRTGQNLVVHVEDRNRPPRIVAERFQVAGVGEALRVDACASTDPDGDELSFTWRDAAGSVLGEGCSLELPPRARPGLLRLELELSDGQARQRIGLFAQWLPRTAVPRR